MYVSLCRGLPESSFRRQPPKPQPRQHQYHLATGGPPRRKTSNFVRPQFNGPMELETLMEEGAAPGPDGENNITPASNAKNGNRSAMANGDKTQTTDTTSNMQSPSGKTQGSTINLYIAAYAANFGAIAAGCALTWSSPTLEKLVKGDDPSTTLILTKEESTWVGSLVTLGAAVGPILSGFLLDRLGRKNTVLFSMILSIMSWIMIGFIPNLYVLFLARLLSGISVGLIFTAVPTYIAEIAQPDLRSSLGTVMQFFLCVGFLLEYVVGPYTSYLTLALVTLTTPIICFASFVWMPDSPYSLLGKPGREDQALKSLRWLRGNPQETAVIKELNEIKKSVEESKKKKSGFGELFANKGIIRAVFISLSMVGFQQLCGINVVLLYSQPIFEATGATLSSSVSTIIIGSVMLGAASITPSLAKFSSMKTLLYISAIGMFLSETALGFYFFAVKNHMDVSRIQWLPISSLVIFIITYCLGYGPLPWAIMGEMFPSNLKSVATSLTASFCWFLGFVLTKNFPSMKELLGMDFVFWLFAFCCIMALLFSIFLLPDTEGKTLQEIQDILHGRTCTTTNDKCTPKAI